MAIKSFEFKPGVIGFKCAQFESWDSSKFACNPSKSWDALYVATRKSTADGFAVDYETPSLFEVSLLGGAQGIIYSGQEMKDGVDDSDAKTRPFRDALATININIPDGVPIMRELGKLNRILLTYENSEGDAAFIIPQPLISRISMRRIATYTSDRYGVKTRVDVRNVHPTL